MYIYYSYCMVVRLGGSSCTVTCYSVIGGMYKILSNIHSDEVGGDLFTQLIALHFSKDFLRYILYCMHRL